MDASAAGAIQARGPDGPPARDGSLRISRRQCLAAFVTLAATAACKSSGPRETILPGSPATPAIKPGGGTGEVLLTRFRPEDFGAAGDGRTNDTAAFARMADAVNAAGGGTVMLRNTTYIVGGHLPAPTSIWAFPPVPVMIFDGCSNGLGIYGNGARLRCDDGLRFGTFDPSTGLATQHAMPFYGATERSSPYVAMLMVQNCTGKVHIEGLELDGNLAGLSLGGPYGDTGWQIPASGLWLSNNSGGETVRDVHSHHHGQDGIYLDAPAGRTTSTELSNVVSEYNGRQGCSIVGGSNHSFVNCRFNHTGRGGLVSAPGAGLDIEAETSPIRNVSFSGCEFSNNAGAGMVADSGDSDGATFTACLFVGTTTWSAWPNKPNFRFSNCRFVGSLCHAFQDPDPVRAAQFSGCSFLDDPALSPTGQVFGAAIADLGAGDSNVLFDGCTFSLKNGSLLPWTVLTRYNNCTMAQAARGQAYPRGTYTGVNRIDGNVDISSSKVAGQLTLNGQLVPPTDHYGW